MKTEKRESQKNSSSKTPTGSTHVQSKKDDSQSDGFVPNKARREEE